MELEQNRGNRSTNNNPIHIAPINASITTEFGAAANRYYEAENKERETFFGKHRLKFEVAGVGVAIALLAINAVVLYEVKLQADAARRQVRIMQDQLEATDRPWVPVQAHIASALTSDASSLSITVLFTGQNIGKSPAQFVGVDAELVPSIGPPMLRQREICAMQAARYAHASNFGGAMLFPNQLGPEFSESFGLLLSWKDLGDYWKQFVPIAAKDNKTTRGTDLVPLDVTGCLGYASPTKAYHQTGFSYRIRLIDGQIPFKKDLPISAAQLRLTPDFAGFWGN